MKPLLSVTDPLYLRRLVRELNSLPDGFYLVGSYRCTSARFSKGFLHVRPCGNLGFRAIPSESKFMDAYGRSVVASRRASK